MSKMLQTKRHNQTVIMYIYKNIFMLAYIVPAPFMYYYTNNAMGKKLFCLVFVSFQLYIG